MTTLSPRGEAWLPAPACRRPAAFLPAFLALMLMWGAQVQGQTLYRSAASGDWSAVSTWEASVDGGMNWGLALNPPNAANNDGIAILSPHTVTITAVTTLDQTIVESGATLVVTNTPIIANGPGTDLEVWGDLYHGAIAGSTNGSFTVNAGATIKFNSGAVYHLTRNGSRTVPTIDWDPNSTFIIENWGGGGGGTPQNLIGQTFGHFQIGPLIAGGNPARHLVNSPVNGAITVKGDFTLNNGSPVARPLNLNNAGGNITLLVEGDFLMPNGDFRLKNGSGTTTLTVLGDFVKSGGTFTQRYSNNSNDAIVNVAGSFIHSGGTYNLCRVNNSDGVLNVAGDFSISAGTITVSGMSPNTAGYINFTGTGTPQVYTSGASISDKVNFTVQNGAFLQMAAAETAVNGGMNSTFTLEDGATLGIRSAAGITLTGMTGNVQVGGLRLFGTGANYVYNGSAAQNTGIGLPLVVNNLTFDNQGGAVNLDAPRVISNFSITTGSVANLGTFIHSANTLALGGAGTIAGSWGHSSSPAVNKNDVFFAANLGIVNVLVALPIELLYFQGEKIGRAARLTWRTVSEKDNDYMAVERSADGRKWEELGQVNGAGTTALPQDYEFTDEKPLPGLNYYRLRQVDFGGSFEYHRVIVLDFPPDKSAEARLYPNPAHERLTVELPEPAARRTELLVFDSQGRLLRRWAVLPGAYQGEFSVEDLQPGMYFLQIAGMGGALRFIRQ